MSRADAPGPGTEVDRERPAEGPGGDDPFASVRRIADAVLYEGYVLYPYRASAGKNRNRWQFGVLVPPSATEHGRAGVGPGGSAARTECLVDGLGAELRVLVRFLHAQARVVEVPSGSSDSVLEAVPSTTIDGRVWTSWDEAVEHEIDLGWVPLRSLLDDGVELPIAVPADVEVEVLRDGAGSLSARLVRRRWPLSGAVRVGAAMCDPPCPLARLRVDVENLTDWDGPGAGWDETTRHAVVAVHVLVAARDGRFVSLMDPPRFARDAAAACVNQGLYPVLAGPEGAGDVVLASPIILYDYPELAPESDGDYFDATEIDEILTLRVLTLTDEEKAEARGTDQRAAAIIDRCDEMPDEVLSRLHGAIRSLRPLGADADALAPWVGDDIPTWGPGGGDEPLVVGAPGIEPPSVGSTDARGLALPWWDPGIDASFDPRTDIVLVDGEVVGAGTKVRLALSRPADAQDMFVAGRTATVTGVYNDVDGGVHLAVVVDDDPAAEMHDWYGRFLYFRPDEVELVGEEAGS